jgi:hypothetical protein
MSGGKRGRREKGEGRREKGKRKKKVLKKSKKMNSRKKNVRIRKQSSWALGKRGGRRERAPGQGGKLPEKGNLQSGGK